MTYSLTEVDEKDFGQHYYLRDGDNCYYFGEYTAREGFNYSKTNQLIHNFKKPVDRKDRPEYQYKNRAIAEVANLIANSINLELVTFIPVPPSKSKDHELYDDRLIQVLRFMEAHYPGVHWYEAVQQNSSTVANHQSESRLRPSELCDIYDLGGFDGSGCRNILVVFDDMLTTGCHFKAMQSVLQERAPDKSIVGLFIARRVIPDEDFDF
ncbi:MAG: hypothetical protein HUJ18_04420 [Marinobacter sp.]|nr:hypothetical protein [Marinobacter sp.]